MIIGTANIKNYPDMPQDKVEADGRRMAHLCDLWGMQENNPAEDLPSILSVLGEDWLTVHANTDIPLFYRASVLTMLEADQVTAPFDPVLPLTPRPRRITGAVFKLDGRPGLPRFAVVNMHMIAGGYNGDNAPWDTERRKRQWDIEWEVTKDFMHSYRERDITVFLLGDFNHPRPPKPLPNWQWLVGERLDRIGVSTNGSMDVDEIRDGVVELNSDHDGQWSNVWLTPR